MLLSTAPTTGAHPLSALSRAARLLPLLLIASGAAAADLTFYDALRQATVGTASVRQLDAAAELSAATARQRAAYTNPELGVRREPSQATVEVAVPLDIGALAYAGATGPALDAVAQRQRVATVALAAAAGAAWLDARRAADLAALRQTVDDLATRLADAAQARVSTGEWSEGDNVLLRADAARVLDRALSSSAEAKNAAARLAAVLGVPLTEDGLGAWPTLPRPVPPELRTLPIVIAADLDARAELAALRAERLAQIPRISVDVGYVFSGQTGPIYGASLALPLFAPGIARVRAAAARAEGAEAASTQAEQDASVALSATLREMDTADRLAAAWDLPGLADALDATARRYAAGELSLPDYYSRRDLAVEALAGAIDARWRVARSRLAAWELSGALPPQGSP